MVSKRDKYLYFILIGIICISFAYANEDTFNSPILNKDIYIYKNFTNVAIQISAGTLNITASGTTARGCSYVRTNGDYADMFDLYGNFTKINFTQIIAPNGAAGAMNNETLVISNGTTDYQVFEFGNIYQTSSFTPVNNKEGNFTLLNNNNISWNFNRTFGSFVMAGNRYIKFEVCNNPATSQHGLSIDYIGGNNVFNSTNKASLFFCNSETNGAVFLNYTFKDEMTNNNLNASLDYATFQYSTINSQAKTYFYSNLSTNVNYPFCFSPVNASLNIISNLQYQSSIYSPVYPLRQRSVSAIYTNSTTNELLYLLNNGIYVTFQVISQAGTPVPGVSVTAQPSIFGTNTTIASGITDSSGSVTFYLNPYSEHTIFATKSDSGSATVRLIPTQSLYTIILPVSSNFTAYISNIRGIYYTRGPSVGLLESGMTNFYLNSSSLIENLANCKLELHNSTSTLVSQTSVALSNSSCYVSVDYNVNFGDTILGYYYVDLGDGEGYRLLENDGKWYTLYNSSEVSPFSLKYIFQYFGENTAWGGNSTEEDIKKFEFSKFVILFFIVAILVSFANIYTSFDIAQPGAFLIGFPLLAWILTIAGWSGSGNGFLYIKGATSFDFLDHIIIALYSTLISLSMILRIYRGQQT